MLPSQIRHRAVPTNRVNSESPESMQTIAQLVHSGMRTAMLAGNGIIVRDLLLEIQETVPDLSIRIYAPNGEHVYAARTTAPPQESLPLHIQRAIHEQRYGRSETGMVTTALENERRCQKCHPDGTLRGIISFKESAVEESTGVPNQNRILMLGALIHACSMYLMNTGNAHALDDYYTELGALVPGLEGVIMAGPDGEPSFGDPFMETPIEFTEAVMEDGPPFLYAEPEGLLYGYPMKNETRCLTCHDKEPSQRGALVTRVMTTQYDHQLYLKQILSISFKHLMLTGLGRIAKSFLDDAYSLGLVDELSVHDHIGGLFHDVKWAPPAPAHVQKALSSQENQITSSGGKNSLTTLTYALVLKNEAPCQRCHSTDSQVRGVIEVSRSISSSVRLSKAH